MDRHTDGSSVVLMDVELKLRMRTADCVKEPERALRRMQRKPGDRRADGGT